MFDKSTKVRDNSGESAPISVDCGWLMSSAFPSSLRCFRRVDVYMRTLSCSKEELNESMVERGSEVVENKEEVSELRLT